MKYVCLFDIDGTLLSTGGAGQRAMERALESAFGLTNLAFIDRPSFADISILGLRGVLMPGTPAEPINGAFWMILTFLPILLGIDCDGVAIELSSFEAPGALQRW